MTDPEKLIQYIGDLKSDADLMLDQREEAEADMRFVNTIGGMWDNFLPEDYGGDDRVKLELDLISAFLQRFIGEWNQNRVGVEYKPGNAKTAKDDSELINGIYRADFRRFSGKVATDNAVDECATCGTGAFKLATVFEDDDDPENDAQHVEWRPIYNSYNTVFWDQSAKRIDKRDARHCTTLDPFTLEGFEAEFPGFVASSVYDPHTMFGYINTNRGVAKQTIYVATRYEIVKNTITVWVFNDLINKKVVTFTDEQYKKDVDDIKANETLTFVRKRRINRQEVHRTVFSGDAILKKTRRIVGKHIPVVSFYAYRAYVDNSEWYRGLVRKLKDAARLFNMQMSQVAENSATGGQEIPIFDPDQMVGQDIKDIWADKNNKPYLLARSLRDNAGNIIHSGPVGTSNTGILDQNAAVLLEVVPKFIDGVTGGSQKEAFDNDLSGKAVKAMIKLDNMNTQVVNDNIANAIAWSGEVFAGMASEIYTDERVIETLGKDGSEAQVRLLQKVMSEQSGVLTTINDLSGKKFQVYSDTGPQYETAREQTVEDLKGMLGLVSDKAVGEQYIPAIMAVLMDNITGVGLDPLKDINRKIMLLQGLKKPETDEDKQYVAEQSAPKEDVQEDLVKAAAAQQRAEAENLEASSAQKLADAEKKKAETNKINKEILTPLDRGVG